MTTRVLFSLSEDIATRFRAAVPNRERSKLIEQLLRTELDARGLAQDSDFEQIARLVETHPDFEQVRAVSADVDRVAGEAFE
jgi:metal-responsive CopG/Arc/MetJ family transcriptional regulator